MAFVISKGGFLFRILTPHKRYFYSIISNIAHFINHYWQKIDLLFGFVGSVAQLIRKVLDAIRDLIRKLKGGENQKLYEMEKLWASALKEGGKNAVDTTENGAYTETRKKLKRYWRPDLNADEWQLLNRSVEKEIGSKEKWLDEATKWTYASEGGNAVFALYGVGDGTDATPLYAVGGAKARDVYHALISGEEDVKRGTGKYKANVDRWIDGIRSNHMDGGGNSGASGREGGTSERTDRVHDSAQASHAETTAGKNAGDRAGLKESENQGKKYSLKSYTEEEKKQHVKDARAHFGRTYRWSETGYITPDGGRLDFSGRHEGGPGGYRTVDHRDIRDALGDDYGGDDYSGSMVQFMSEGSIRVSPESGGIDLSVKPTKAQEEALSDFISKQRGEVILDLDTPDGQTVSSTEYPRGTHASKVIADIRAYFEDGTTPEN